MLQKSWKKTNVTADMNLTIRPAVEADAAALAGCLAHWDGVEVDQAAGDRTREALLLEQICNATEMHTLCMDEKPIALFGINAEREGVASVGFLGTPDVLKIRLFVIRESRKWIEKWGKVYGTLCNAVHEKNSMAIRWIELAGFVFPGKTIRFAGDNYLIFQTERKSLCAS